MFAQNVIGGGGRHGATLPPRASARIPHLLTFREDFAFDYIPTLMSAVLFIVGYRIVSMESDRVVGRWSDSVSCIGNQLFRRSLRVDTRIYRRPRKE